MKLGHLDDQVVTDVRKEVAEMVALGRLPSEQESNLEILAKVDKLHRGLIPPVTDEEARMLVQVFGDDGCFGIASSLMHLIETAPGWPLMDCFANLHNPWMAEMKQRCIREGQWPSA